MTLDCTKTLQKGSTGSSVTELQKILKAKGYYDGKIDGDYGSLTVEAVKKYQKSTGTLAVDGVCGPVTCKKLNSSTSTPATSYYKNGVYYSGPHWEAQGCNKKGQCNAYNCGPHSTRQCLAKQDIDQFHELDIARMAGTTSNGTGHSGLETAIAEIARRTGRKIKVSWKNFSDLGSTRSARWHALGKLIATQNVSVFIHNLYRRQYGHYEVLRSINMNNSTCIVLNSLGNRCNYPAYCGYNETRSFSTMESYMSGISQRSICILTFD